MTSIKPDTGWSMIAPVGTPHTPKSDVDYRTITVPAGNAVYVVDGVIDLPVNAAALDVYVTADAAFTIPDGVDGQRLSLRWWTDSEIGIWTITPPDNLDVGTAMTAGPFNPLNSTTVDYWEMLYCAPLARWWVIGVYNFNR